MTGAGGSDRRSRRCRRSRSEQPAPADLRDVEVVRAPSGAPSLRLHGEAAALAAGAGVGEWRLTLAHTSHLAQAIAVAL